ncbi:MAG: hypothetical protein KAV87_08690, partial [Desulfobacteraceae bacterium]|nr:hypothetical protein [Desulfobacteraceae bacterium]
VLVQVGQVRLSATEGCLPCWTEKPGSSLCSTKEREIGAADSQLRQTMGDSRARKGSYAPLFVGCIKHT